MAKRRGALFVVAVAVLGAAACGNDDGSGTTAASATTETAQATTTVPSSTTAPTTTAPAGTTEPPPPDTWLITATSVGPVELGMPVPALGPATGIAWVLSEPGAPDCVVGTALDGALPIQGSDVVTDITVAGAEVAETPEGIRSATPSRRCSTRTGRGPPSSRGLTSER